MNTLPLTDQLTIDSSGVKLSEKGYKIVYNLTVFKKPIKSDSYHIQAVSLRKFSPLEHLTQQIESLIFTTDHPIDLEEISNVLEEAFGLKFPEQEIISSIDSLIERYQSEDYAFEIVEIDNGYQFLTKGAFHNTVGVFLRQTTRKRLSRSALETLSIIAYKQPATKSELEKIRGVSCDYAIQKLLGKELVQIVGRSDGPGKPLLYATSPKFMDYFGLRSIDELPKPKEFQNTENAIGEQAPIDEDHQLTEPTAVNTTEEE